MRTLRVAWLGLLVLVALGCDEGAGGVDGADGAVEDGVVEDGTVDEADDAVDEVDDAVDEVDGAVDEVDGAVDGEDREDGDEGQDEGGDGDGDGEDPGDEDPGCTPGERRCLDSTRVEQCSPLHAWELLDTCDAELGESCDHPAVRCLSACEASLSGVSNLGCVFWPLALANHGNEGYDGGSAGHRWQAGVRLFVSNPGTEPAALVLRDRHQVFELGAQAEVPPGGSVVFDLPQVAAGEVADRHVVDGSTLAYAAFRLSSSRPVFVIQMNPAQMNVRSSDASLLLPQHALGRQHLVLGVPHSTKRIDSQTFQHPSSFSVVATREATRVRVRVTAPMAALTVAAHETEVLAEGHLLGPLLAGEEREFLLQPYEVLQLETAEAAGCAAVKPSDPEHGTICIRADNFVTGLACHVLGRVFCQHHDPSGSLVSSDRPVAVFTASRGAMVPYYMFGTEHLEEQLPPVSAWGKVFLLDRLAPRYRYYTCSRGNLRGDHLSTCPFGSGESFWRVMAAEDDTRLVLLTPVQPVTIEEAPKDFNYHNQVDWVTGPLDEGLVAGESCQDQGDGLCRVARVLQAGEVLAFGDVWSHVLVTDKAVLVLRLTPSEEYVGIPGAVDMDAYIELLWNKGGDPALEVVVPADQFRADYALYVAGELKYGYLGLAARVGQRLVLDEGTPGERILDTQDGSWEPLAEGFAVRFYEIHNLSNRDRPREIEGASYQDDLEGGGYHTLRSLDGQGFGVRVYGFDHYVSYAYPGGLDLEAINAFIPIGGW